MANPAALLHAQLVSWNGPHNEAAEKMRGVAQTPKPSWRQHRRAARHLDAIAEILNEMADAGKRVRVYQDQVPVWTAIVFAHRSGWTQSGSAAIPDGPLAHLDTLAGRLDDYVPVASPESFTALTTFLADVLAAVDADTSLPGDLKDHIRTVVKQVKRCVDD